MGAQEIISRYGNDSVRFYLCSIMPENADANFNWTDFKETHNNILIANTGNFINRNLTLAKNANLRASPGTMVCKKVDQKLKEAHTALSNTEFKKYIKAILDLSDFGNKYLAKKAPWEEKNHDGIKFDKTISSCVYITLALQAMITPLMPETHEKLADMTGVDFDAWPNEKNLKMALKGIRIKNVKPLFKRMD